MNTQVAVPQLKLLDTERYHDRAMAMLNAMFKRCQENLAKRNYNVANAAVLRQDWRDAMREAFGLPYSHAGEDKARLIEENLQKLGKVIFQSTYVVPAPEAEPEPVMRELTVSDKYFCHDCRKFKGIPREHLRYFEGEQVNYTVPGRIATNHVGPIQYINGQSLKIATGTKYINRHINDVTPLWAPTPLTYDTFGKCWCDIDPAFLPGGASCHSDQGGNLRDQ